MKDEFVDALVAAARERGVASVQTKDGWVHCVSRDLVQAMTQQIGDQEFILVIRKRPGLALTAAEIAGVDAVLHVGFGPKD